MKRGSFTQDVKEEVCTSEFAFEQIKSILSGFVFAHGATNDEGIFLATENSKIAKLVYQGFHETFKISPVFTYQKKMKLDKCVVYHVNVMEKVNEILLALQLNEMNNGVYPRELVLDNSSLRGFITGVFLATGSVNSPKSDNYHLQMIVNNELDGKYLIKLLNRFHNERNMDFKMIKRRNKYIVYLKKADQIANFLAVINACISLMDFENIRIQKDFINSDNRYQICFNANYQKTIEKANGQIEDIKIIESTIGLNKLDEKQRLVAQIRLDNNDLPLSGIADILKESHGINISKSSVNRIFSSIHELALRYGGK